MKKQLMNTYYDEANNWYELVFDDGEIIRVNADDYPEAATNEDFWDNDELIEKILSERL